MGWKNVEEHYKIDHIVQVVPDKGICIGSPYIHDLIVIDMQGNITRRERENNNNKLNRYLREMEEDPAKLRELVLAPDTFKKSIPVYTFEGAEIIEEMCEKPEWPNVTHSGKLMYENMFFNSRADAIRQASSDNEDTIKAYNDFVLKNAVSDAEKAIARVAKVVSKMNNLNKDRAALDEMMKPLD